MKPVSEWHLPLTVLGIVCFIALLGRAVHLGAAACPREQNLLVLRALVVVVVRHRHASQLPRARYDLRQALTDSVRWPIHTWAQPTDEECLPVLERLASSLRWAPQELHLCQPTVLPGPEAQLQLGFEPSEKLTASTEPAPAQTSKPRAPEQVDGLGF